MDVQSKLDVFHVDPEFETHEAEWAAIKKELLGEESDDGDGGDGDGSGDESSDEDSDEEGALPPPPGKETQVRPRCVFPVLVLFASFSVLAFLPFTVCVCTHLLITCVRSPRFLARCLSVARLWLV